MVLIRPGCVVALTLQWGMALAYSPLEQTLFGSEALAELRNNTKDLFFHSWNNYRDHALPADELKPLTCEPAGPDPDITNFQRNDVMGNFSITLLDTLDMFPILGEDELFAHYVDYVDQHVTFDVPSIVQVFETTIRAMGGLLSAHMYASVYELGHSIENYDGHLLEKAYDLAMRLLPAFETPTGIPHPRVHLRDGVVPIGNVSVTETCSAGAGSLLLEFGLLSRLTGDPRFESLAKRAFLQVWDRRSDLNLVGMGLDAVTGEWLDSYTGIGASVDSFYEYALKYAILFNDNDIMNIWKLTYDAIQRIVTSGWFYHVIDLYDGEIAAGWVDALTAFWAGVQVLAGDVQAAVRTHLTYYKLWNTFGGIPERWGVSRDTEHGIQLEWYLLRPEFIESNYYLSAATGDPFYLQVAKVILEDLETINKVPCGVASVKDVRTGELDDRMDSFFLSETLKYLYLTFDPKNPLNTDSSNFVFSTEAHPFWSKPSYLHQAAAHNFPRVSNSLVIQNEVEEKKGLMRWVFSLLNPKWISSSLMPWRHQVLDHSSTCQTFDYRWFGGSVVTSSEVFYKIDEYINFTKPDWLYRKDDIEQMYDFSRHYTLNEAVCLGPPLEPLTKRRGRRKRTW